MYKKLHFVFVNIIPFLLIVLYLALPLLDLFIVNSMYDTEPKKIFGLTLLSGFSMKNEGLAVDGNNQLVRVMSSELLSFVPILMLISIVLIDKATKSELGKHIINFLCLAVCFIYILLLPVIAPTSFLTEDYINLANFERIAGYWINFAFICIAFIYFTVVLIYSAIKLYKENKEKERNA